MHYLRLFLTLVLLAVAGSPAAAAAPDLAQAARYIDSDPQRALDLLLPLAEQADAADDDRSESIALRYAGMAYHRLGNPDKAAALLQDSLELARSGGFLQEEGDVLNTFGIYCFDIGMFEQSQRYFLQALELRRQTSDSASIARTTNNLGLLQDKIGNFDQAIEYYRQSLALKESVSDTNGRIITLNNMGRAFKGKGDLDEAIRLYREALELSKKTIYPEGEGYAQQNLGAAYRQSGELQQALIHCEKALEAYRSIQYQPRLSYAAFETALTYQMLKEYAQAWQLYSEALELASRQNQTELRRDILQQLALLCEEQGDLGNALSYFKQANILKDALASAYNREKILILDAEHRSERQQAEISLLKQNAELSQNKLNHQYMAVAALSAVLLSALCGIAYFRRQVKLRRASEQQLQALALQLEEANERLNRLATTDSLTKMGNRRQFDAAYSFDCARAEKNGLSVSLILADIDFFKQYNDHFGHLAGDRCLRHVAAVLRRCLDNTPYWSARYGGEEFALVLYDADLAAAAALAENFRQLVEELAIVHPHSPYGRITVSLGLAVSSAAAPLTPDELFKAADDALYRAKEGGRNRLEQ